MSLRDDLKAVGLSDEQATSAENVLRQFVAGEYIPKSRFDEVNNKNKELATELGRQEANIGALEKRAKKAEEGLAPLQAKLQETETSWKQKYEELDAGWKQKEQDRVTLETYNSKLDAVKKALGESAYDSDMIVGLMDFDSLEFKDGKVSGVDKALQSIRKEKPFLFKDEMLQGTAPQSSPVEPAQGINFGELLAKKASATDALTQAAADKYFK